MWKLSLSIYEKNRLASHWIELGHVRPPAQPQRSPDLLTGRENTFLRKTQITIINGLMPSARPGPLTSDRVLFLTRNGTGDPLKIKFLIGSIFNNRVTEGENRLNMSSPCSIVGSISVGPRKRGPRSAETALVTSDGIHKALHLPPASATSLRRTGNTTTCALSLLRVLTLLDPQEARSSPRRSALLRPFLPWPLRRGSSCTPSSTALTAAVPPPSR